ATRGPPFRSRRETIFAQEAGRSQPEITSSSAELRTAAKLRCVHPAGSLSCCPLLASEGEPPGEGPARVSGRCVVDGVDKILDGWQKDGIEWVRFELPDM